MISKQRIESKFRKDRQSAWPIIRQMINQHQTILLPLTLLLLLVVSGAGTADAPQSQISNGIITADLKLPDAKDGYYRGVRFDWSGVISDLTYKGHHYFGKWFERYEPTLHDAIMGPVDAYDPIGYDRAKPGEPFVKIGVGTVEKIADEPYAFV